MKDKKTLPRRNFIQIGTRILIWGAGLLGLGGLVRYFSHKPESMAPTIFDLGPAADFPDSGKLVRRDIPVVIYKSDEGYKAYSLVCTHLGCTLEEKETIFFCPCHGSEFGQEGRVLKGPAIDNLPMFAVELNDAGVLILNTKGEQR